MRVSFFGFHRVDGLQDVTAADLPDQLTLPHHRQPPEWIAKEQLGDCQKISIFFNRFAIGLQERIDPRRWQLFIGRIHQGP